MSFFGRFLGSVQRKETERSGVWGEEVDASSDYELQYTSRALWIGTGGNIEVQFANSPANTPIVLENVADGTLLPIAVIEVYAANTTASGIVAIS